MLQTIGKYKVLSVIGSGAMGTVYQARDPVLDRVVAVKVISENFLDSAAAREKFLREARTAGRLQHPNIVTIFDSGEDAGLPYLVMEYLAGMDLRRVIGDRMSWPLERKISVLQEVAEGVAHAHQNGVIHRDIKPANIHILPDGSAKIVDFGIARLISSDTQTVSVSGTGAYMSPEQCRAEPAGPASDIWSMGVVLYELLTFRRPFEGESIIALIHKILNEEPVPVTDYLEQVPASLSAVLEKSLAKTPSARYSEAAEMARDLERLGTLLESRPAPGRPLPQADSAPVQDPVERRHRLIREAAACIGSGDFERAAQLVGQFVALGGDREIAHRLLDRMEKEKTGGIDPGDAAELPGRETVAIQAEPPPVEEPELPPAAPPASQTAPAEPDLTESLGPGAAGSGAFTETPPGDTPAARPEETPSPGSLPAPEETERLVPPAPPAQPASQTALPEAPQRPQPERPRAEPSRPRAGSHLRWVAGVLLLILGGAVYHQLFQGERRPEPAPPPPVSLYSVSVDVRPWAEIVEIRDVAADKSLDSGAGRHTPLTLALPAGHYRLKVRNDRFGEHEIPFRLSPDSSRRIEASFPGYEPGAVLKEFELE